MMGGGIPRSDTGSLAASENGGTRFDGTVRILSDAATTRSTVCSAAFGLWGDAVTGAVGFPSDTPEPLATSDCNVMAPRVNTTRAAPRPTLAHRTRNRARAWRMGFSTTT